MNEAKRQEILARYRAHARRFDEAATDPGSHVDVPATPIAPYGEPPTARQVEVLQLIADGLSNHEIARQLVISEETVKTHVRHLLAKLGANSRAHAVGVGLRTGLVT
jgi:DNA-binding NarL/FixJ family response regulator